MVFDGPAIALVCPDEILMHEGKRRAKGGQGEGKVGRRRHILFHHCSEMCNRIDAYCMAWGVHCCRNATVSVEVRSPSTPAKAISVQLH